MYSPMATMQTLRQLLNSYYMDLEVRCFVSDILFCFLMVGDQLDTACNMHTVDRLQVMYSGTMNKAVQLT